MTAMASAGLPALSGFPGEFLVLLGTFTAPEIGASTPRLWAILGATGVILAAVYILWMVQRVLFGPLDNPANEDLQDMNFREVFTVACFMGAALVLGLAPNLVLDKIDRPVGDLVMRLHQSTGAPYQPDAGLVGRIAPGSAAGQKGEAH